MSFMDYSISGLGQHVIHFTLFLPVTSNILGNDFFASLGPGMKMVKNNVSSSPTEDMYENRN